MRITIVDYGMGNLRSVQKAVEYLGYQTTITADERSILNAEKLILPGVGAFAQAIENLEKLRLKSALQEYAKKQRPLLGICLGMQLLMTVSEEHGQTNGLDLIAGKVLYFRNNSTFPSDLTVPHMGWNDLVQTRQTKLFTELPDPAQVYFLHSYYVKPANSADSLSTTGYGLDFCSAVNKENIFGVQFHPEKSGRTGLQILKNFIELI